jgi:hypothetical protein
MRRCGMPAKTGDEFIKHEFDEAIAVQRSIVEAETTMAQSHPLRSAKSTIKQALTRDRAYLKELETLGRRHDATGEIEDVAGGLKSLMEETLQKAQADGADSDYYEAHAVLLNLKRKQMDSASGMLRIARDQEDTKLRDAAREFAKAQKSTADELATELATYAVEIARA